MQSSARTTWWAARLLALTCTAAAVLAIAPAGASAASAFNFQASWGNTGFDKLNQPTGVDVDDLDNVFVADYGNDRVQKFDVNGQFLGEWGSTGAGDGRFTQPYDVAADATGKVYVADGGNDRIQIFTNQGVFVDEFGSTGTGDRQFHLPTAVALDSAGYVYVLDSVNNRVQKFTAEGDYRGQWGTFGAGVGQFDDPFGLEVDATNNVYVSDHGNDRVQKFEADGTPITTWGSLGAGVGQFDDPTGITSDSLGNVFVADRGNDRVQYFGPDGTFIDEFGLPGSGDGQFVSPWGIAEGSLGTLFISDSVSSADGDSRIERFGEDQNGSTVRRRGSELIFQARADHENNVTVTQEPPGFYTFTDTGDAVLLGGLSGGGCSVAGPIAVTCTDASVASLQVKTDDRGDTVVNFTATAAVLDGGAGDDTLTGGSGSRDTASYAEAPAGVSVSVAPGALNTGGGGADILAGIENLVGSDQDDTLTGDGGNNTLSGAAGNDMLSGGGGDDLLDGGPGTADTVSYASSGSAVNVDLSVTSAQPTGGAGVDTISAVENLTGTAQADTLAGDGGANTIKGDAGDDTLLGRLGDDTLDGGPGARDVASYSDAGLPVQVDLSDASAQPTGMGSDTLNSIEGATGGSAGDRLQGSGADNPLDGGPGDDTLRGGPGDDAITGGTGTDAADYSTASTAITADLSMAGAQPTGGAGSDSLAQIENLSGSPQNDQLAGDGAANSLTGAGGDDVLRGEGGADTLSGGSGADTADYSSASSGVTVSLSLPGSQQTGGGGPDSLAGMEDLVGSAHADVLTGSDDTNSISAGAGDDTVRTLDSGTDHAGCGAGLDTINADALDTVDSDCETVTIGAQVPPGGEAGPAPPAPDRTAPALSGISVPLMRFGLGGPINYVLSEPGRTTFRFDRVQLGRRVKGKCVRATKRNRRRRTCRRYLYTGAVAQQAGGGQNIYAFAGRVGSKPLTPGPYRLTVAATDASGNRSREISVKFAVIR